MNSIWHLSHPASCVRDEFGVFILKHLHDRIITHYNDVIIGAMASQITSLTIVYSTVYSDADQRQHESSASLAFVRGIHRWPVNSPHNWRVTRKIFPFDDVIMGTWLWKWSSRKITLWPLAAFPRRLQVRFNHTRRLRQCFFRLNNSLVN